MFKLLVLVFSVLFAVAMAVPGPKPQILVGAAYPYAYSGYGVYPTAYAGGYGGYYGGYVI